MDGLALALEAISNRVDDLFAVEIEGIDIAFRLPPIKTAKQFALLLSMNITHSDRVVIYESIFRHVVEDEWMADNDADLPAGIPETMAKLVLLLSGLDEGGIEYTEALYSQYRYDLDSTIDYMKRIVCYKFPGYTFESLDKLNYQQLVYNFIQAEKLLLKEGIIEEVHSFGSAKQQSPKQSDLVSKILEADQKSLRELDEPPPEVKDAMAKRRVEKIRQASIERAQRLEREHAQRQQKGR